MTPDKIYVDIIDDEVLLMSPSVTDNGGVEYIRKELVEHIIRAALGPQDALYKIRSL